MKTTLGQSRGRGIWALGWMHAILSAYAAWWEQGHDTWYLKDDWKAAAVPRYSVTLPLQSPAREGWIVIWGDQGVRLAVNDRPVLQQVDRGLIYDTNLTRFVQGAREVRLEAGPGRIVAEGEIVDDQGRVYPFASGCAWPTPAPPGLSLPPSPNAYRPGASAGAFDVAHNGQLLRYNDEERGKSEIAHSLARLQKLRDQSIFLLRRFRPAAEIFTFAPDTLWRQAESYAARPMAEAENLLRQQAIPAQKERRFRDVIDVTQRAGALLAAAENAVQSARELEELERHLLHLSAGARLIEASGASVSAAGPDLAELRALLEAGRRCAATDNWAGVEAQNRSARSRAAALEETLARAWGRPLGRLDEFPEDQLGWLNAPALMGNDPSRWAFAVIPSDANWIDLRGYWWFRTDPTNQGETLGWISPSATLDGWHLLRVPLAWERQEIRDENDASPWDCPYRLDDLRCDNKFYNGYAWYRRSLVVPAAWAGRDLILRVGQVANWLRVFANGQPVGEAQRGGGRFVLPARLLHAGETNHLALQIYNHTDFGGVTGGPVSLAPDDTQPDAVTTPGPLSFTTELAIPTRPRPQHLVLFSSAMSPGVVLVSDQTTLRFWGWEAKGQAPPGGLVLASTNGARQLPLDRANVVLDGAELAEGWLMVSAGEGNPSAGWTNTRPTFLVLERRPRVITWNTNGLGYSELALTFSEPGCRVIVFTPPYEERRWSLQETRLRAQTLRAVPIACSELVRLYTNRLSREFLLHYHYWELPDFAGQGALRAAPVPMLVAYAFEHEFPGLVSRGFSTTTYRGDYASYRLRLGAESFDYALPWLDRTKLRRGVGELFAKRRAELNARGGNTEDAMFDDWQTWGFDHVRYAMAWSQDWDLPLQAQLGGPITNDPQLWSRLDELVRKHTDRGLMAMLCYFFNEDQPQRESRNLVRNSSRYWRLHPETRTNCYALWRRIAERYRELPPDAVAYDFFNEPAYLTRDDWNQTIKELTTIVRAVDPQHLIVIEAGDGWSQPQWFHWLQPTGDTNTLYSFHHYGKHWGYHYDQYYPGYAWTPEKEIELLLEAILFGIRHRVPLHCGEFGVSMISPGQDHAVWLNHYLALLERFGIGWNWWNWSGTDIYRTGLKAGHEVSPNLAVLRQWIQRQKY